MTVFSSGLASTEDNEHVHTVELYGKEDATKKEHTVKQSDTAADP